MYITDVDIYRAVLEYFMNDTTKYYCSSFYQGAKATDVERFAARFLDIMNDRNYSGYTARVLVTNDGASEITALHGRYINSFGVMARYECFSADSDEVIEMLHYLIDIIKGRKLECIVDDDSVVYVSVPCDGYTALNGNYFYVASFNYANDIKAVLVALGVTTASLKVDDILYFEASNGHIYQVKIATIGSTTITVTLLHELTTWKKRKISVAMDEIVAQDPVKLNGAFRTQYFLSGKATVTDSMVELGNDLVKVELSYDAGTSYIEVEPISAPSDIDFDTQTWRTDPSKTGKIAHNSEHALKKEYEFVSDYSTLGAFFKQLANEGTYSISGVTANTQWYIRETISNYGVFTKSVIKGKKAKVTRTNTNGDVILNNIQFEIESV